MLCNAIIIKHQQKQRGRNKKIKYYKNCNNYNEYKNLIKKN